MLEVEVNVTPSPFREVPRLVVMMMIIINANNDYDEYDDYY